MDIVVLQYLPGYLPKNKHQSLVVKLRVGNEKKIGTRQKKKTICTIM